MFYRVKNIEDDAAFQTEIKYGLNQRNFTESFQFKVGLILELQTKCY